jgi:hypothetical protein
LFQGLEFYRGGGDVGDIDGGEDFLGGLGIVVGGASDKGESGEGDDRVDGGGAVADEVLFDGGTLVEAAGEGGDGMQAARLHRGDDAVVMGGVAGDDVGAHHQQADGAELVWAGVVGEL